MYLGNQALQRTSIPMSCNSKFSDYNETRIERDRNWSIVCWRVTHFYDARGGGGVIFHVHMASLRIGFHKNQETISSTFTANGICYTSFNENIQYFECFEPNLKDVPGYIKI